MSCEGLMGKIFGHRFRLPEDYREESVVSDWAFCIRCGETITVEEVEVE